MDNSKSITPVDDIETDKINNEPYYQISKINNYIYLGSFEHPAINSDEFKLLDIDVIINCAAEIDYPLDQFNGSKKYVYEKFPIVDGDLNTFLEHMDKAIETLAKYLSRGKKIYLHCHKGVSRSPAILAYFLMYNKHWSYFKSLSQLRKKRSIIDIDDEFVNTLRVIEEN